MVAISGVWNFVSGGEPIADMFDIAVEGRRVTICFDSDMLTNPNVQDAVQRLAGHLIERKAKVTAYSYTLLTPVGEGGKERSMASRGSDP